MVPKILKWVIKKSDVYQGYEGPEMGPTARQKNYPMCLKTRPFVIASGMKAPIVQQHLFDSTLHCQNIKKLVAELKDYKVQGTNNKMLNVRKPITNLLSERLGSNSFGRNWNHET